MKIALVQTEELLKQTTSRCPVCHCPCPGEVWKINDGKHGRVVLKRTCPTHGGHSACVASDSRFYWLSKGDSSQDGNSSCCGGIACRANDGSIAGTLGRNSAGHGSQPFETLATCLALIEIVNSCNLSCPTCYADSPLGTGGKVDAVPFADVRRRVDAIIGRKGPIEILQFSGGEPTLHPDLFDLLRWARDHEHIEYLLLNTNGVRLANDSQFAEQLGKLFSGGGLQIYLQFDGPHEGGQRQLRGADLRIIRSQALDACARHGLPVTLAMTVTPENISQAWDAIQYGIQRPHVHGITFQPQFGSGRIRGKMEPTTPAPSLNAADVLLAAIESSGGKLRIEDFTPLPCGDPNCATIGYLIRKGDRTWSVSDFIDFKTLQGFLRDKMHYTLKDLAQCGCENEPLGELLKMLELKASMAFRIMIKPFMDAWSWDQHRIDRCCTHVIRPDGELDSFCRLLFGIPRHSHTKVSEPLMGIMQSPAYGWLMLAGIAISLGLWLRWARRDERLLVVYIGCLLGAFFGAKIAYLMAEGLGDYGQTDMWRRWATGKSILGALPGGYVGVEVAKYVSGYRGITGDWFAIGAPLGISFGRIGCLLQGCCLGREFHGLGFSWLSRAAAHRWPAVPVEILFNLVMVGLFLLAKKREVLPGQHFHVYLIAYGVFRFLHEFLRETPKVIGPFSVYQLFALTVAIMGIVLFEVRRRHGCPPKFVSDAT